MSVLGDVKHYLGIEETDTYFDPTVIMCINSVFSSLIQVGVSEEERFTISDYSKDWSDFVDDYKTEWVKINVCANVKRMFDPPTNGTVMEALDDIARETQWRAYIDADNESV